MDPSPADPIPALTTDAVVVVAANLVYVTTGTQACAHLRESATQVALTPVVAHRIAEILKVSLQYADLPTRQSLVEAWGAGEVTQVPHGSVQINMDSVRFGIEPLGAGARVAVLWQHVPALILCLEHYSSMLRRQGS